MGHTVYAWELVLCLTSSADELGESKKRDKKGPSEPGLTGWQSGPTRCKFSWPTIEC